jgi:hypothetical protein
MSEEKSKSGAYSDSWEYVKKELSKGEMSANKVAILEAEKIFQETVDKKGLPGDSLEDKIKNYSDLFSDFEKLTYSRAMYKKLIEKLQFDISRGDTEDIIRGYKEAVKDLEKADFGKLPAAERAGMLVKRKFYGFPQKIKLLVLAIIALSMLTFILTETETGRMLSSSVVAANNYLFYKIIPTIFLLALLAAVAVIILYSYRKKDK